MISISISCEQSELPALQAALAGVFGDAATLHNVAKNDGGNIICRNGEERQDEATKEVTGSTHDESPVDPKDLSLDLSPSSGVTIKENKEPKKKIKLTDDQKAEILDRHGKGQTTKEIGQAMQIDARRVHGYIMSQTVFKKGPDSSTDEGRPPEVEAKPKPRSIGRAQPGQLIWDLWKAGKTLEQISDELYAEGLYYSEKSVRVRLISQGADL